MDVGQGDAVLLELAGGVRILTDAGPDAKVVDSLERTLPPGRRYIDIAIITHPDLDHFNGFNHLLERYRVGAFVFNGRGREENEDSDNWFRLVSKIEEQGIPFLALGAGDGIRHGPSRLDILSPDAQLLSTQALNETSIVAKVRTPEMTALLTGDIGASVEEALRGRYDLAADVLKVSHHGSKYSSSPGFLLAVRPSIAVVSAGERNRYGHPTPEVLQRLAAVGADVFRTDQNGTVTIKMR